MSKQHEEIKEDLPGTAKVREDRRRIQEAQKTAVPRRGKKKSGGAATVEGEQARLDTNESLNRNTRTGRPTEDEQLLQRTELDQPQAVPYTQTDPWRVFRIMGEFVHGFDALSTIGPAVSIFGSARTKPEDPDYQAVVELSHKLSEAGFAIITGGGPGIMEAANKGAKMGGSESVGCNIELPHEQGTNPYVEIAINFRYFFVRKTMFMKYSEAFVIFPGGFGTLDELFEALTLIQTGKVHNFPVILYNRAYWQGLLDWIAGPMMAGGKVDKLDLNLLRVSDDLDEICQLITDCYNNSCWDVTDTGFRNDLGNAPSPPASNGRNPVQTNDGQ